MTRQRLSRKEVAALPIRTYEEMLAGQLRMLKIPHIREYGFHSERRWRFDFAVGDHRVRVAVEVEGGVYVAGRHTRGASFEADCEKYNEAAILGWTVLRCTPKQVESGQCVTWIEQALGREKAA